MHNDFMKMKSSLSEQVCTTLGQHGIAYDEQGVEKNLDCYIANKMPLIELLRKHPKWDETSLAVVFDAGDIRRSTDEEIASLRTNLEKIAQEVFDGDESHISATTVEKFKKAIKLLSDVGRFIAKNDTAKEIRTLTGVDCKVGQRASRVVHKICESFGITEHSAYNSVFTVFADALNPLAIEHKAVLSLHPCDYIEMSAGYGWFSDFGMKEKNDKTIAGTLSLLNDSVSMIFYTLDNTTTTPYCEATKINGKVFCYENGLLLQSRLYPQNSDEGLKTTYRNLVQQIFAECVGVPNLWALKKREYVVNKFYELGSPLTLCSDYTRRAYTPNISLLKSVYPDGIPQKIEKLIIGRTIYCVKCGTPLSEKNRFHCESCA